MVVKRNKCTNRGGVPYQGFSLIELLAVIVILAIIALIATPIVLSIINDTKESSLLRSAEFYLAAVEQTIAQSTLNDKKLENKSYNILNDGNICIEYKDNECINKLEVKVSGEVSSSGSITIENGKIKDIWVVLNNKTMVKDNNKWYHSGLYDENDNLIATWDELVNVYGINVEKNYANNDLSRPGAILLSNEKLNKGVKLVIDYFIIKIGKNAFHNYTVLKEVVIPSDVTSIGAGAFRGTSLSKITIPNNVESIGNNAFEGCTYLSKISIPNSVVSIGRYAFDGCSSLKEITIPNSVISIGDHAFAYCKSLKNVIIPNNITSIEKNLFEYSTNLEEITIPSGVTNIDSYAFRSCSSLKIINFAGTQVQWNSILFGTGWNNNMPTNYQINYNYAVN